MKKKILLVGPPVEQDLTASYGGGTGGYTRKMQLYLSNFQTSGFEQVPCFHTVRGQRYPFGLIGRFCIDLFRFLRAVRSERVGGVHLLGQYRGALLREYAIALVSRWLGIPYLYEIKAGVFIEWYESTNGFNQWLIRDLLRYASVILAQGQPYVDYLKKEWELDAVYFPNFVASAEWQPHRNQLFNSPTLRVLFVGFAFREKGVFELVTACRKLSVTFPIQLTMIGKEEETFSTWLDQLPALPNFTIKRLGKLPHEKVLEAFAGNDVYCYPTRHTGEGHNNTINEAMMSGLVVITTRQGFLESIIGHDRGYLLEESTTKAITSTVREIMGDKEEAQKRAERAREHVQNNFLDKVAFAKLERAYQKMTGR